MAYSLSILDHSQCALSHPSPFCHAKCKQLNIRTMNQIDYKHMKSHAPLSYAMSIYQNTTNKLRALVNYWEKNKYIKSTFFLATSSL